VPNIKDVVAFYRIGIFECSANLIKIVPANRLDNGGLRCNPFPLSFRWVFSNDLDIEMG
jgi:hypothetical protein